MPVDPLSLILLVLLGSWVAADSNSVGQIMVSRPLVAATLAGWLMGAPAAGAAAGVILEIFHLTVLPVGAARYPEGGPAAVCVGAVFAASDRSASTMLTALVFFLVWAAVSGASMRGMRQLNGRLLHSATDGLATESQIERRHLMAIGLDLARGAGLVAVGIPALHLLLETTRFGAPDEQAAALGMRLSLIVLLAGAVHLFGRRTRLLAAGAAAGILLLLIRS